MVRVGDESGKLVQIGYKASLDLDDYRVRLIDWSCLLAGAIIIFGPALLVAALNNLTLEDRVSLIELTIATVALLLAALLVGVVCRVLHIIALSNNPYRWFLVEGHNTAWDKASKSESLASIVPHKDVKSGAVHQVYNVRHLCISKWNKRLFWFQLLLFVPGMIMVFIVMVRLLTLLSP